jgi:D-alanyl-D-alanine carboxypeptidase
MLLPSGNDAATALASHFGKLLSCMYSSQQHNPVASRFENLKEFYYIQYNNDSIKMFMFLMNRMSSDMGMKDTHFENPTGLQHQKSHSTAYDMALLSTTFSAQQTLMSIVQKKNHSYNIFNHRLCTSKYCF